MANVRSAGAVRGTGDAVGQPAATSSATLEQRLADGTMHAAALEAVLANRMWTKVRLAAVRSHHFRERCVAEGDMDARESRSGPHAVSATGGGRRNHAGQRARAQEGTMTAAAPQRVRRPRALTLGPSVACAPGRHQLLSTQSQQLLSKKLPFWSRLLGLFMERTKT